MDIKTIILVIFLVVVCIYIYREFSNIKYEIASVIRDSDEKNNNVKLFIREQHEQSINKIKNINNEYIHQIRKINMIHNEPIKKSSDCYTENDSECEFANKVKYLSDSTHECVNVNMNNCDFIPYMSHDEKIDISEQPIRIYSYLHDPNEVKLQSCHGGIIDILVDGYINDQKDTIYANRCQDCDFSSTNKIYKESVRHNSNYVDSISSQNNIVPNQDNNSVSNQDNYNVHNQDNNNMSSKDDDLSSTISMSNQNNNNVLNQDGGSISNQSVNNKSGTDKPDNFKLENISEYKMDDLRKIARDRGTSLSAYDGKKMKPYSKQELYDKINEDLKNNKI